MQSENREKTTYVCRYPSPFGSILLTGDGAVVTGLWFEEQSRFSAPSDGVYTKELPIFETAVRWLNVYFSGKEPDFTPPLSAKGSPFRGEVWEILLTVPYGKTITYREIAERIAAKRNIPRMSAQAVGGAVGHNPISLIIPCHRVIGTSGDLVGYAAGIERKAKLLALERSYTMQKR